MHVLKIATVDIPIMDGSLGVAVSGGADSSLLLYLLMQHSKRNLHIFTYAKNSNYRVNAVVASKIIEKCIQLTGNNRIEHHVRYEDVFDRTMFFELPLEYSASDKIQYMYTAVTANPPREIADSFLGHGENTQHDKRDPTVQRSIIDGNWVTPFHNIDKQSVYQMYKELGILSTLFPFTFSCESVQYAEHYEHCGSCWWCKERNWGFGI